MLSLRQYQELNSEEGTGVFDKMIRTVSIVNDADPEEVEEWRDTKLLKEFAKSRLKSHVSNKYNKSITIEGTKLNLIDWKYLCLGQFIDIENYINNGYIDNLHKIIAVLYLQTEGGGMYESKPEPIENVNVDYRSELILDLPAQSILGAATEYLNFRKNFFDSYDLFDNPLEGADEDEMDEDERIEFEEEKKRLERDKKTQWMRMVNTLADNDITKIESVLKQNLFLAFNQLDYLRKQ